MIPVKGEDQPIWFSPSANIQMFMSCISFRKDQEYICNFFINMLLKMTAKYVCIYIQSIHHSTIYSFSSDFCTQTVMQFQMFQLCILWCLQKRMWIESVRYDFVLIFLVFSSFSYPLYPIKLHLAKNGSAVLFSTIVLPYKVYTLPSLLLWQLLNQFTTWPPQSWVLKESHAENMKLQYLISLLKCYPLVFVYS